MMFVIANSIEVNILIQPFFSFLCKTYEKVRHLSHSFCVRALFSILKVELCYFGLSIPYKPTLMLPERPCFIFPINCLVA